MTNSINVLDHGFIRLVDHMGSDLSISRAARVSYDAAWRAGEDQGSDARLIRYLWKNAHTSPFEAVTFTFEVKAPIFVFRQWHRHRTWCLSGETMISFEMPNRVRKGIRTAKKLRLDDLFRKWNDNPSVKRKDKQKRSLREFRRDQIRKMQLRVFDEKTQQFTIGHICDVVAQGVKRVFEITLADGKTLKCTEDHRLLTPDGWQTLKDTVGLVVSGKTAGMTKEGIVLTNGYVEGDTPWNKGVTGYKTRRMVTDAEKSVIRAARSGPNSNFWKGGISTDRANIGRWTREQAPRVHRKFDYTCQQCFNRGGKLHAHHVESVVSTPEKARDFDNLITLCESCHRKHHLQTGEMRRAKGQTLRAMETRVVSVRLVGEEPTYDLSVAGDNHNFVANGVIVHNCFNELSARYRELPEEFYVPDPTKIGVQSMDNKQARIVPSDFYDSTSTEMIQTACTNAFVMYRKLLDRGIPRELARSVLPVATYSHMFATVNLLNLFRFCTLRSHEHAQYEIRVYSDAMLELIQPIVPVAVAAFRSGHS